MKDPYNEYIMRNGRMYRYDPDYDCYYSVKHWDELSTWDKWSPLVVITMLAAIAVYVEFLR